MAKKKQGLKPDIVLKNYWDDNERFADLFNAVLFEGRQVIAGEKTVQPLQPMVYSYYQNRIIH